LSGLETRLLNGLTRYNHHHIPQRAIASKTAILPLPSTVSTMFQQPRFSPTMISIDFFGCKRAQILACSVEDACDRFPCTGITIPDASALTSLSEVLTGNRTFFAEPVPLSSEPLFELSASLQAAIRKATADDLIDAGARWAQLPPWKSLETNPMDLAGFLLHLQSLIRRPDREENAIFIVMEAGAVQAW
jgi:hypothetical protein